MSIGEYEKQGEAVGEGTYGTVWKGINRLDQTPVAMKKVLLRHQKEGIPTTAVREIQALRKLQNHPNVVKLHDVYTEQHNGNVVGDIYLIFEYLPHDLTGFLSYRRKLKLSEVKNLGKQLLDGLEYCHVNHVMHRDLKPSNILLSDGAVLKLCDFGLSRGIVERVTPGAYSTRVITLWYRPPELLLGAVKYNYAVDVWSAGCIIGELLYGGPLFGDSSEIQVVRKIRNRCAAFTPEDWPESLRKLQCWDKYWQQVNRPPNPGERTDIFNDFRVKHGQDTVNFFKKCMQLDPAMRADVTALVDDIWFEAEPLACARHEIKMPPEGSGMKELGVRQRMKQREEEQRDEEREGKARQKRNFPDEGRAAVEPSPKRQRPG